MGLKLKLFSLPVFAIFLVLSINESRAATPIPSFVTYNNVCLFHELVVANQQNGLTNALNKLAGQNVINALKNYTQLANLNSKDLNSNFSVNDLQTLGGRRIPKATAGCERYTTNATYFLMKEIRVVNTVYYCYAGGNGSHESHMPFTLNGVRMNETYASCSQRQVPAR